MTGGRASGLFAVLVFVVALAGGAAQRAAAAFPGVDGKIAFVRNGDIYVVNPDGTSETPLTSGIDFDFNPSWSPNGQRIAFSRNSDIWVMRSDGTQQEALTAGGAVDGNPTWSPDGGRLAFERGHEIFVMNVDGTGAVNVTNHPEQDTDPAWSPNGQRIAFMTRRDDQGLVEDRGEVYTMNPDGSGLQRLTSNAGDDDAVGPGDRRPSWRPDGLELAFDSDRVQGGGIFLMNPDGSGQRQVPTAPLLNAFGSAWSPQGRELVFSGSAGADGDLYITTATGVRRLTTAPGYELAADWGPEPDRDGDGLPDRWETSLIDLDGDGSPDLDLAAMGAHPDRIDVFVEIDSMTGHKPSQAAVNTVVTAFANAPTVNLDGTPGIALHVDNGPASIMNPSTGATWGSLSEADTVPHDGVLGSLDGVLDSQGRQGYVWAEFDLLKLQHFKAARKAVFHYAVAAHRLGDPSVGLTGLSRGVEASDFIVSLGVLCPTECNGTDDQQAGTLMHELGHNLGLRHGGNTDEEFKPNYFSVMNYFFQLTGLKILGSTGYYDYSRFGAATVGHLDENALSETDGFGTTGSVLSVYGSAFSCGALGGGFVLDDVTARPVDWNCNGTVDAGPVANDLNNDGSLDLLTSFNDWANLVYTGGSIAGAGAGDALPGTTPVDEAPAEVLIAGSIDALASGDAVPPATTATATPTANTAGWHRDTVIVQLSATDDRSGVSELVYSLGGAETTVPAATVSIAIAAEGATTLTFFARDAAGNAEAPQTLVVRIDRTAPDAALHWSPVTHELTVSGEDALSGVADVVTTTAAVKKHETVRRYVVTDRAGNARAIDVHVREHGEHRLVAELQGAELDVHWHLDKDGSLRKLDQKAETGSRRVDADFEAKDAETRITDRTKSAPKQRFDRPGLALLTLRVGAGGVAIDY